MSSDPPQNLGVLLREPFRYGTYVLHQRFIERGHDQIRPVHGNVFQFLDDEGTRIGVLAERAQVTRQSMAELVDYLEGLGYVERLQDPGDRRATLVRATSKGNELYAIAREVVAELEQQWTRRLGKEKMRQLRSVLEELNAGLEWPERDGV